jgi:hypothetical protein
MVAAKGTTPCSAPTCDRPALTRGLCPTHYQRWRQHGDVMPDKEIGWDWNRSMQDRFRERVDKNSPNGCHLWTAATTSSGYGAICDDSGRQIPAHRAAYMLAHEMTSLPPKTEVCHRCDNPPCVNPDHLFLGTRTDNVRDMLKKGRSPHAKLTTYDVRAIRRLYRSSAYSQQRLAAQLNVSPATIWQIVTKQTWRQVV